MAVRRINHDRINPGAHQCLDPLLGALAHADRRANPQLALCIARRIGKTGLLGDVLDRDQTLELKRIVDDQQALDLVLVQQHLGFFQGRAIGHGHQFVALSHDVADRQVQSCLKPQIPPGDQTYHLASVADRKTRYPKLFRQAHHLAHSVLWRDHHRITQHT